ncbi:flavoprotein [Streptomyces sp. NPDC091292]|uniref:flavoprotein n=1 Tax=Streptomyces sp. NPDC091292 TaxID=3365991 RepID=UPI00382BE57E
MSRTVYLFGSAAPPVLAIDRAVEQLQRRGWDVCLGLTPAAADWLGERIGELAALTGHPVRSAYKRPGAADVWPRADVILFAPATFNSLNAWALGLTDRFVVGVVAEAVGKGIPTVAMPCVNAAYAQHTQLDESVARLRAMRVEVLYGGEGFVPNQPGEPRAYPWDLAFDAIEQATDRT